MEEKEEVASLKSERKVQKKEKVEKKVVKIEVKSNGMDNRWSKTTTHINKTILVLEAEFFLQK